MSYYRPTLHNIRDSYVNNKSLISARPWDESENEAMERLGEQFDTWIANVQFGAYILALNHIFEDGHLTNTQRDKYVTENPYGVV